MKCYCCGKETKKDKIIDMHKHSVCKKCISCKNDNSYSTIEMEIDNDVLLKLAMLSIEEHLTINMLIIKILKDYVNKKDEKDNPKKKKCHMLDVNNSPTILEEINEKKTSLPFYNYLPKTK